MSIFLTLAFLFCIGSLIGWVLELLYRNILFGIKEKRGWINPGFCTGPYLPLYGFGLCSLYLIASSDFLIFFQKTIISKAVVFIFMAISMTLLEYIAGIILLKFYNLRLWDYSTLWGNINGIICPLYSLFWAILGALYYFFIHPYILDFLTKVSQNMMVAFSVGIFFGFFIIDVVHSLNLIDKMRKFANENQIIIKYESIKENIKKYHQANKQKYNFFKPFKTDKSLNEHLLEMLKNFENKRKK